MTEQAFGHASEQSGPVSRDRAHSTRKLKGVVSQWCVHGSLPYRIASDRDVPKDCMPWVRHSEKLTVFFAPGHSTCGLPYGSYPRLLLAWMATEVARTGSTGVELGDSVAQFFAKLGLVPTGGARGTITAVKDQLHRLLNTTIKVQRVGDGEAWECRHMVSGGDNSHGFDPWWKAADGRQRSLWQPRIELSADFFRLLRMDPVEIELRAINALSRSPLAIDIYFWSRFETARRSSAHCVEWAKLFAQFGGQSARHKFVENFKRAARSVSAVDHECRVATDKRGAWISAWKRTDASP